MGPIPVIIIITTITIILLLYYFFWNLTTKLENILVDEYKHIKNVTI